MKGLLLFMLATQTAHAGTVLMPAFFPEEDGDKAHANQFHDSLLIELIAAGHTAIGQDALRSRVGRIVDSCAVTSDCPERLFSAWPAPVAVIGEVYSDGDDKGVVVSIYASGSSAPVRVFDQTVLAGEDWGGVQGILDEVAGLMPEASEEEGALTLLESNVEEVRAVQAEGAAAEAQQAEVVERLGYVETEMRDEEILELLGLGDVEEDLDAEGPAAAVEEAPAEDLATEAVVEAPVTEAPEADSAPEEQAVLEGQEADLPAETDVPVVVDASEEGEASTEEEGVFDLLGADDSSSSLDAETPEATLDANSPLEVDIATGSPDDEVAAALESNEEAGEEDSVYDVEVLPVLPEIQLSDEAVESPRSSRVDASLSEETRGQSQRVSVRGNSDREERRRLNLDPVLYGSLKKSSLSADEWLQKWRPHVNNAHIEVFGGVPYGDVVRSYDVRLTLDANSLEPIGSSQRDLFVEGIGYEFGASFGYTPIPWLDFSALFSVLGGVKELTTAWFTLDGVVVAEENLEEFSPAQSWQAIVEPRLRVYLLPVSWVKLYGLGGITLRFSDSF